MAEKTIDKTAAVDTNLEDYEKTCQSFQWFGKKVVTDSSATAPVNIAFRAVDCHLDTPKEEKLALRWLGKGEDKQDFTYRDLAQLSNRFANVLKSLGFQKGTRVFSLAGRLPLLYISTLGVLKAGCVFTPLFSAFGPEPIRSRMEIGQANILITTISLYRKKVAKWWRELVELKAIFISMQDVSLSLITKPLEVKI